MLVERDRRARRENGRPGGPSLPFDLAGKFFFSYPFLDEFDS
jgi:hypothetical protein